ncbi:MAG TPA: DEAD/DEAH box helicase [Streptosporangiaceae bacterium]|jgi:ATP-dependent RNA helicase HelY
MSTPAQRYAAFRARQSERGSAPHLDDFRGLYDFDFDEFQIEACRALEGGDGVLVAAPTGSGKTVVGEFAVHLALATGMKCFYTTPIKALSNQKYNDLVARHGAANVGLLTGDNTVNGEAPVVVMTTEVLRNMLYASSATLSGLGFVVLDEVHYLADRFRGAVWEEVIIHLPESVRVVALSATVSNAEEFGEWLQTVRGDTTVIVDEHRPVPLFQHMLVGPRMYDLFVDDRGEQRVNESLLRIARDDTRYQRERRNRPKRGGYPPRRPRFNPPSRVDIVERLDQAGLLPAITFIFSRAGCDAAVRQCLNSGLRLTTADERREIRAFVEKASSDIPDSDLGVLGYGEFLAGLENGVAAHHAGMLPTFKEIVEGLFVRGLVKAVFATETLALGINMPARSVVIEKLDKWNGETHADLTPGEYTQLTGRAGRRGIDVEGHAVVVWQPGVDPVSVGGLASTRTYPLNSSFKPSYNMAVNLVGQVGRDRARNLLEASFAQFQADRAVVGLARQMRKSEDALLGYSEAMTCDQGDFAEYAAMRRELSDREADGARQRSAARRAEAAKSLERLRPGDIIRVPGGKRAGMAVIIDPGLNRPEPAPLVLTIGRQVKRLSLIDFPSPVEPVARVRIPNSFSARSPQHRRDLASTLRNKLAETDDHRRGDGKSGPRGDDPEIARLRRELRAHPCHACPDREEHARWAERYFRLKREVDGLRRRVEARSHVITRTFDRVCAVLEKLGYLTGGGERVTDAGRRLGRLYSEMDLLTAECLRTKVWSGLGPAELAACVSALVYEERRPEDRGGVRLPGGAATPALEEMHRLWGELDDVESAHKLSFLREPEPGFAWTAYRWANGAGLDTVLRESDLTAGDFVRWMKQLLDLLGQIATAGDDPVAATARRAADAVRRGVVAYSSVT